MKFKKSFILLATLPLVAGCSWFKKPLVIPTVDVEKLDKTIKSQLPSLPTRNQGSPKSEEGFDYINLYELSDFHGAVNYEVHSKGTYAGLPRLATYFETKREANPGGTIILSGGDMFQGSADSNLTRGYMVNYSMQYMGFDAMALGNHEFDWTDTWIKKNAELKYSTTTIPYLGANIKKNGQIPSFLKKSVVIQRGEYKIGVIGIMGSELENSILQTAIKNYEFTPYYDLVSEEASALKTAGCNAVVMLAHEGADVIHAPTNVDMVFGGHAHQNFNIEGNPPVLATLNYGQSVACATLKFDSSTKNFVSVSEAKIENMSEHAPSLSENANIKKIMNLYAPEINKIKNIKLGTCAEDLTIGRELKNIATRSMFDSVVDVAKTVKDLKIDSKKIVAAFTNVGGGIRVDIGAGDITYGDVYRSFPFDNELVLIKAKGSVLADRLSSLSDLGCYRVFDTSDYFKSNETYYICTTDYVALSDLMSGFMKLSDKDLIRTGKILRDEVANKIYQVGNVRNNKWSGGDYHYESIPMVF